MAACERCWAEFKWRRLCEDREITYSQVVAERDKKGGCTPEQQCGELKLMERKVITCGVAATNPDANLTLRADYMQWDSPQAAAVRALRKERDGLRADLTEALDLLRACFTAREATSEERRRFDALMEKHKEKP